jgi:tape measure domain-containing protein
MARIQIEYTANISQLQASLDRIIDKNRQIATTARQASLAMGNITQSIAGASGAMQNLASSMRGATAGMTAGIRNLNTQLNQLQRQTSGLNSTMSSLSSNMSRIGSAAQASRGSVSGLASVLSTIRGYVAGAFAVSAIVSFGKEVVDLTAKIELLQSRLAFIYGGTGPGENAFIRISSAIKKLGLEFESTMEQATAFSIAAQQAGYTTTETEKMFISFASALRASGASSLQVQRSFYALQQMMSKGVVSAEELNRQMGESLPGAAMLMFKAYKNLHPELVQNFEDFRKLQKEGKIISAEVLPEFIRVVEQEFAPALAGKTNSLSASLNRLSQVFSEFKIIIFPQESANAFIKGLTGFIDTINTVLSSERLSSFEKFVALFSFDREVVQDLQGIAFGEKSAKESTAISMQARVAKEMEAFNKLDLKQKQDAAAALDQEIARYKTYVELILKSQEALKNVDNDAYLLAQSGLQKLNILQRPVTLLGKNVQGYPSSTQEGILSIAQEVSRNMAMSLGAPGTPTGDDAAKEGKTLRELALESEINRVKALIAIEKTAIEVFNHNSGIKFDTTKNLMELNIELITLEEEIKNLRQKGSQEELNAAERNLEIVKENIKFMEEEQKLLLYQMELEKNLIEERLANATSGSIEEYRIREELMIKTADIEKKKVQNNAEAVKKITAQTNAEIKNMYDDLEKRIKEFLSDTEEMIAAPFRTKREQEIADINKKFDQRIQAVTEQYQLGTLFTDQRRKGRTPEEGLSNVLKYIDLLDRLNKARKKALSEVEGGENILGLSDEDLQKLQKALQVAIDLFQDYYAARTEIAKNAIEKEQALLDKKFEAGLIRENEYNEETKKNKEEMAKLDRDAARFGVLINTAQAIMKLYTDFDAITATILAAGVVAVGATQLSAINSAPLPEFHEGGLDIKKNDNKKPNRGLKSGEFYAKLLEGESVMTREETAKYKDVLKAIREDSLPSHIMKGYTAPAYHRSMDEPYRMAKEQTSLELAFQNAELVDAIRRNGAVAIKNPDEIADAIVSKSSYTKITNRRRIR